MKFLPIFLMTIAGGAGVMFAADAKPAESEAKPAKSGGWVFSLLPKSLQRNPRLDFNIITEMTPAGRKVARPSAEKPAYYVAESGGMHNEGLMGGEANLKGPSAEQLRHMLEKALAQNGYIASANDTQRPTLAIIYQYGAHGFTPPAPLTDPVPDGLTPPPDDPAGTGDVPIPERQIRKALLDRASLIGGAKFVKEVAFAMEQVDQKATLQRTFTAPDGGDFMGSVGDGLPDPFEELRARSDDMARMVDELFSSSYFVVATAYDYAELAKGHRVVLWRTKMTVNSLGVDMKESLPPLVASAAPYLGRETVDPVVISKRIDRTGNVEIGTPTVIEGNVADPNPKNSGAAKK
ncbi:MAG TPA: hypothetical protein VHD62_17150 [Opitutaceae bacterium]|nr:hypothetical protein [Opitutaceae bacterium]